MRSYCLLVILGSVSLHGGQQFKLGLEAIPPALVQQLSKQSVALISNHTGKTQQNVLNIELLKCLGIRIATIFVPEHGFYGTIKAGVTVDDEFNKKFNIPIMSLYKNGEGKKISESLLSNIDVLLFDMQDVGMRHYTYVSTLYQVMDVALRAHKKLILLDRPNPLGGIIEGPLVDEQLQSFISIASIPLRHGMTFGELARYFNMYIFKEQVQLQVVPMQNYNRNKKLSSLIKNISPNIPTLQACYGYSFLGLLGEVRPCDVGIGTLYPFGSIGLAQTALSVSDWQQLQALLSSLHVTTLLTTYTNPRKRDMQQGLRIHIKNIEKVPAFTVFIKIAQFFKQKGVSLIFSPDFDKAAGTALVRKAITQEIPYKELVDFVNGSLQEFYKRAQKIYLYAPWPVVVNLE